MKTLVTGASGFLGRALFARLLADGEADIRVLFRSPGQREVLEGIAAEFRAAKVEYVQGNLVSRDDARRVVDGVARIYHLAAGVRGAAADMCLNTVVASKNLLEAVGANRPVRVVLVSSFSVYGAAELPRGVSIDEQTPLERHPERRDPYTLVKLRQEQLCRELAARHGFELVVLRPGVIYGPGGAAFSSRVGMELGGVFLFFGGNNLLPLSYVDNCAEAIAVAGRAAAAAGETYNVHDDNLPTCRSYLAAYRNQVGRIRAVPIPYPMLKLLSAGLERYHHWSQGQLPAALTPYRVAASWGGNRFGNAKLKGLGWAPSVSTDEGMRRTFAWLKRREAIG